MSEAEGYLPPLAADLKAIFDSSRILPAKSFACEKQKLDSEARKKKGKI